MNRPGHGPWARLLASAVVRDEGSAIAERGRMLVQEGAIGPVEVRQGTLSASVNGCSVAITATPVPPRIWAAMTRFARGNRPVEEAVAGRAQSVHLDHVMIEDWSEPLVPRSYELGRTCSCDIDGELCEHVAALAYAVANGIDADPSLLLRWRGCVASPELPDEATMAVTPEPASDLTDDDPWRAGALPKPRPLRPLPVGAVLKRLGPSGLKLRGEDLSVVLERAYASFAESADTLNPRHAKIRDAVDDRGGAMQVVHCPCGVDVEGESDDQLVENVQAHIASDHPEQVGNYSREQILDMAHKH